MQWWCSAQNTAWTWQWRPYPGVWLFVVCVGVALWRWNRAGAQRAGRRTTPLHPAAIAGLFVLWLALDWPLGALGAGYLASVHMLQFQLIALVAAPLLLRGISADALAMLRGNSVAARVLRRFTAPAGAHRAQCRGSTHARPADRRRPDGHADRLVLHRRAVAHRWAAFLVACRPAGTCSATFCPGAAVSATSSSV